MELMDWCINMKCQILLLLACLCIFGLGCKNNVKQVRGQDSTWESLGEKLQHFSKGRKSPDDILKLNIKKPDVDTRNRDDRTWMASQEFELLDSKPLLENKLAHGNFDSYEITMVWLGAEEPSTRHAYIITWKDGQPKFFEGVLCCVN